MSTQLDAIPRSSPGKSMDPVINPEKREDVAAAPGRSPTGTKHLSNITRAVFRTLAAFLTMALGGLLGTIGVGLLSTAWNFATGTAADYYSVELELFGRSLTLKGWQIYASAAVALFMAISLIALGLSFFPRRKPSD